MECSFMQSDEMFKTLAIATLILPPLKLEEWREHIAQRLDGCQRPRDVVETFEDGKALALALAPSSFH